ncbi:MAG: BatD family protein, partial [Limisphaerales bacterium]
MRPEFEPTSPIPRGGTGFTALAATLGLGLCFGSFGLLAQPTATAPNHDPLMSLMLSQPRIDVDSPVSASAVFDPPAVRPGEKAIYRVTFNALEESVEWPNNLPVPSNVEVEAGGHGQMLSMAGAKLEPRTAFNFRLQSKEPGQIVIPEFTVMVYGQPVTVPAAQLEVTTAPPPTIGPAESLVIEVPETNLFVGEAISVNILFPGLVGIAMQGQAPVQLVGEGFVADQSTFHPRFESRARGFGRSNG